MAVSSNANLTFQYIGNPAEKGGPHGYFAGSGVIAGDVSGGISTINIVFGLPQIQGLLLLVRRLNFLVDSASVTPVTLFLANSYWDTASRAIQTGATIVGRDESEIALISSANPLLIRPEANINSGTLLSMLTANTDGETNSCFIQGDFWQESRLRQEEIGPLIRW